MLSYTVYRTLDVWVPSVSIVVIFLSLLVLIGVKVGWKLYRHKQRLVNRWFFEILRIPFRDLKRDEKGRNSIYGHEIGRVSFALLVMLTVPVIISACFLTFWNIYMVEEQVEGDCNLHYDCFPTRDGEVLDKNPVKNCSSWPPDVKFKCYRLVYSYVRGVSSAGGLMFFASVMFKIYIVTLLAPRRLQSIWCKWICYLTVLAGGVGILFLFILVHSAIPHTQSTVFQNDTYKIQFFLYSFLLFVVFFITGPLLIYGIECEPSKSYLEDEDRDTFNLPI